MVTNRAAPPKGDRDDNHYAQGLRNRRLLLQRCAACASIRFPVGPSCPNCWSESFDWMTHDGAGEVVSFVWYMKALHPRFTDVPYNVAMVRVDGGPVLVSNIVGVSPDELKVGRKVKARFEDQPGDFTVLLFE